MDGRQPEELTQEKDNRAGRLIPHPIHFREGMQIRNALRGSGLCEGWDDHDLDDNWAEIVERAIEKDAPPPKKIKLPATGVSNETD